MGSTSTTETAGDVLLFYPNIIGYLRILFTCLSVYYSLEDWQTSMVCYLLSFCCDCIFDHFRTKVLLNPGTHCFLMLI